MPLVNLSNLNFDQIKVSIRDYLKANSNFTDYDFEGSNLSQVIDILAYNTYISSYNANMLSNEVFIDSATLRENIVSLARNIGYIPKSRKASTAIVSFEVNIGASSNVSTITLQPGPVCTTNQLFGGTNYVFSINREESVKVDSDGKARFNNISIYQGLYVQENFTVDPRIPNKKYILGNSGIDTDLIRVTLKPNETSTVKELFNKVDSLYDIDSSSRVYFLQEVLNERYELLFGDGIFGKKLTEGNLGYILADYIITDGAPADGIADFAFNGRLLDQNGSAVTTGVSVVSVNQSSQGGGDIESVESIRKYSTQIYSTRNRAVTSSDYEAIIPKVYPETESVSAFGGEDLNPPQYGKVFISVKPENGTHLSSTVKRNILNNLKKYSVAGIIPEIIDLKYLYIEAKSSVYYNSNLTPGSSIVSSQVLDNIQRYSKSTEINKFGGRFKYSKFQKVIDDSHRSITSNVTKVEMRRDLEVKFNQFAQYEICFGNRFFVRNHGHSPIHGGRILGYNIRSSGFKVSGISDTVYLGDRANSDLTTGTLLLFKLNSSTEPVIVKSNIGTIDYVKGELKLTAIKIIDTSVNRNSPLIEISATPYSNDVVGLQDLYLQIDMPFVKIDTVLDSISDGGDISGSNYVVSGSFDMDSLVRGEPSYSTPITQIDSTTTSSTVVGTTTGTVTTTSTPSTPSTTSPSTPSSGGSGGGSGYGY